MKFALGEFAIAADVLACSDPWGQGMVFKVHRFGSRRHEEFRKRRSSDDSIGAQVNAKLIKRTIAAAKAAKNADPKPVNGEAAAAPVVGADGVIDVGQPPAEKPRDEWRDCFLEVIEEKLDRGKVSEVAALFEKDDHDKELAIALCDGWSGVNDSAGQPVEFSGDALRELLNADAVVGDGFAYAGALVGDALTDHIIKFAREHSLARAKALEAAGKDSAGPSAGA